MRVFLVKGTDIDSTLHIEWSTCLYRDLYLDLIILQKHTSTFLYLAKTSAIFDKLLYLLQWSKFVLVWCFGEIADLSDIDGSLAPVIR
jgi:hypothetical protein